MRGWKIRETLINYMTFSIKMEHGLNIIGATAVWGRPVSSQEFKESFPGSLYTFTQHMRMDAVNRV